MWKLYLLNERTLITARSSTNVVLSRWFNDFAIQLSSYYKLTSILDLWPIDLGGWIVIEMTITYENPLVACFVYSYSSAFDFIREFPLENRAIQMTITVRSCSETLKWEPILVPRTRFECLFNICLGLYTGYGCFCFLGVAINCLQKFFKFCTNIRFRNSFDNSGGENNPSIFTIFF